MPVYLFSILNTTLLRLSYAKSKNRLKNYSVLMQADRRKDIPSKDTFRPYTLRNVYNEILNKVLEN